MTPAQKEFITDCLWAKYDNCDRLTDVESLAEFCTELDLEDLGIEFVKQWKKEWAEWVEQQNNLGLFI